VDSWSFWSLGPTSRMFKVEWGFWGFFYWVPVVSLTKQVALKPNNSNIDVFGLILMYLGLFWA
jgi:hypothetical protein